MNEDGKVVGEDGQPIASLKAQDFVKTNELPSRYRKWRTNNSSTFESARFPTESTFLSNRLRKWPKNGPRRLPCF